MEIPDILLKMFLAEKGEKILEPTYGIVEMSKSYVVMNIHGRDGQIQPVRYSREELEQLFWPHYEDYLTRHQPVVINGGLRDFKYFHKLINGTGPHNVHTVDIERDRTILFDDRGHQILTADEDRQAKIALARDSSRIILQLNESDERFLRKYFESISDDELFEALKAYFGYSPEVVLNL